MAFTQVTVCIGSTKAEELSDIFANLGCLSVSIEDQYEGTEKEEPIFNEPGMEVDKLWECSKVISLFNDTDNIDQIIKNATELLGQAFEYDVDSINDQNWVSLTQSQFKPIKVSDTLFIVPSWHSSPNAKATNIILDPGLAFGTGTHATTFMCLKWLNENISNRDNILDYGCGSGILAITAKKLGAINVSGVDVDSQAIEASIYNANNNQVEINWYLPQHLPSQKFDIVVANILSNPLRILAPILAEHTQKILILSGILETQIDELSKIYQQWFNVTIADTMDGWVLLQCEKI
ncbi:MAG: 50S ribosomal protein L11 methyltransferase [Neisseriaceae bacterium]